MRRPAHLRVTDGRSIGVAEHHAFTGLTRYNVSRLVAVVCIGALALVPALPAHAVTSGEQITATRNAIDAAAQRWFDAQAEATQIDAGITDVQHQIAIAQARMEHTRAIATARAVVLYKNADVGLAASFGDDALDSARRAQLVDDANAGGDAAIAQLTTDIDNLNAQRRSLEKQRDELRKVLRDVATQRHTLDSELAVLRGVARRDAAAALESARNVAARARAENHVRALAVTAAADTFAAPTAAPLPTTVASTVVTAPVAGGRVSPHHDDPFLVCTRARESGGHYDAVSPSGYYGAYQFLPSTWDVAVVHEGRTDLVGVLPSRASQFDQDETAWSLYQWQGKGPWGGRC